MGLPELWDRVPDVQEAVDNGPRAIGVLSKLLSQKADLDKDYSRKLKSLVDKNKFSLSMVETDGESQIASLQLKSYLDLLVDHYDRQSKFGKQQSEALSAYRVTLRDTHKKLKTETRSLNDKLKQYQKEMEESKNAFDKCILESDAAKVTLKQSVKDAVEYQSKQEASSSPLTTSTPPGSPSLKFKKVRDDKHGPSPMKFKDKFIQVAKSRKEKKSPDVRLREAEQNSALLRKKESDADIVYMEKVKAVRTFRGIFDQGIANVLERYQRAELGRLEIGSRAMSEIITFERQQSLVLSEMREIALKSIRAIKPELELKRFVERHKTGREREPLPSYKAPATRKKNKGWVLYYRDWTKNKKGADKECVLLEQQLHQYGFTEVQLTVEEPGLLLCATGPVTLMRQLQKYIKATHEHFVEATGTLTNPNDRQSATVVDEFETLKVNARGRITELCKQMFEEDVLLDDKEVAEIYDWFRIEQGREAFAKVLGHQRNSSNKGVNMHLLKDTFFQLKEMVLEFLREAKEKMHAMPAQMVMIMSQSFYYTEDEGTNDKDDKDDKDDEKADDKKNDNNEDEFENSSATRPRSTLVRGTMGGPTGFQSGSALDTMADSPPITETMMNTPIDDTMVSISSISDTMVGPPQVLQKPAAAKKKRTSTSSEGADKIFLQTHIKHHPIWKDTRFWEESFFSHIQAKMVDGTTADNDGVGTERWRSDTEQEEALRAQKNFVFSSLGTFAHNMREFDMDKKVVRNFVAKFGELNQLDKMQIDMILQMESLSK